MWSEALYIMQTLDTDGSMIMKIHENITGFPVAR